MRLAWYTPLSPVESGISLYNEELLPLLAEVCDIEVVVDGYRPTRISTSERLRIVQAGSRGRSVVDRMAIYQMGNSPAHSYMLDHVERQPGVLVLHDTMLHHLYIQHAVRGAGWSWYQRVMRERYGDAGVDAAARVLKGQSPPSLFAFPLSESLIDASLVTIVHSERSRREILARQPNARVERVPMGIRLPPVLDKGVARDALGMPHDQFVIASITHVNPQKRLDAVLRALVLARRETPARLVIAGSVSPGVPLDRWIGHLGLGAVVDVHGYVGDDDARMIAAAADVIVNLRYPTAGETSASLLRSMAAAKPVIVTDGGSFTELTDDAVLKVPVDALEEEMLAALFCALYQRPSLAETIGRNARHFIEEQHTLPVMASRYLDVLGRVGGVQLETPAWPLAVERYPRLSGHSSFDAPPWMREVGRTIAELGVGGNDALLRDVATAAHELGFEVGKIRTHERVDALGDSNGRREPKTD